MVGTRIGNVRRLFCSTDSNGIEYGDCCWDLDKACSIRNWRFRFRKKTSHVLEIIVGGCDGYINFVFV